jgi:proteasome lid subunit RPN8/RPN11
VLDVVCLAEGTTAHAAVPTADILRAVLSRGGQALALAHNHPGGSLEPSKVDRQATEQVRAAAAACGLRFLDHLIVAEGRWRRSDRRSDQPRKHVIPCRLRKRTRKLTLPADQRVQSIQAA